MFVRAHRARAQRVVPHVVRRTRSPYEVEAAVAGLSVLACGGRSGSGRSWRGGGGGNNDTLTVESSRALRKLSTRDTPTLQAQVLGKHWKCSDVSNEIRALFPPSLSHFLPPTFSSLRRHTYAYLGVGVWGGRSWVLSPAPARIPQSEERHAVMMRRLLLQVDTKQVIILRHTRLRLPPEVFSWESANPKLSDSCSVH